MQGRKTKIITVALLPYLKFFLPYDQLWPENIKWKIPEKNL
jgi:hypothetical protein